MDSSDENKLIFAFETASIASANVGRRYAVFDPLGAGIVHPHHAFGAVAA